MGLIRKQSLYQLLMIQNMMNQEVGDIGEKTTKDYENHYDTKNDTDITDDVAYDMSNKIQYSGKNPDWNYITRFGQGNFGECIGDLTDQKYANHYWTQNPLDQEVHKELDTYEDFDQMFSFAPSWSKRDKDKVQKLDYPDKELFKPVKYLKPKKNESYSIINESRIYKFDQFVNENKEWIPKIDEISIILNYLKINYPIKEKTLRIDKSKSIKYIMIDNKPQYFDGFFANKTRIRKKLYQKIKYKFENFQYSSINKAIKIYINEEL
ncbi:MAG: hypothetical protein HPY57_13495 [Ignavibacteria bacterium]|nr:hypothetical protein [Ignavibacteria bacterium]